MNMLDFARISLAVPNVTVGSVTKNKADIIEKIKEASGQGADFVLFPELALTGYTCGDLFFQKTLQDNVCAALCEIAELSAKVKTVIIVGAPLKIKGQLYNCGVVLSGGRVCAVVPKTFIPDYNEFSEKRWFSSALTLDTDEIMSDDIGIYPSYPVAVSNRIVLEGREGTKFGVEVCEDMLAPIPPSAHLALSGAEIIFNLSASNETVGKHHFRKDMVSTRSSSELCVYAYASAGCSESTTDLVFSGHSIVCENGSVICENKQYIDNDYIMNCDVDLGKIRADRARIRSFADCAATADKCKTVKLYNGIFDSKLNSDGFLYPLKKLPFVPTDKQTRTLRCLEIFDMQAAGLVKRMSVAASKIVIGVSGGLDSTLAILVCAEAMRKMHKPMTDIIGVTMPCFGTTSRTYNNSLALMEQLGVTSMNISIKDACLQHFKDIGHDYDVKDVTFENVQARERTQVLMDVANKNGAIVCGTGDLSELTLGWCTYNADHMSMYDVNAGIPKTLIRWMLESLAEDGRFAGCEKTLLDIADTPISPELLPPDESGEIAQKTEDSVGPYALHDFFLYYTLRYGFTPEKIYILASRAFAEDFDGETVKKWLKVFYRRFFTQQFKRSCLADGVKVGSVGISPRGDLKMPSDASFADYMERIEAL